MGREGILSSGTKAPPIGRPILGIPSGGGFVGMGAKNDMSKRGHLEEQRNTLYKYLFARNIFG
jgi:hypothetical protein